MSESDEVQLKEEPEKKAGQKVPGAKSSKQQECIVCKKVGDQCIVVMYDLRL